MKHITYLFLTASMLLTTACGSNDTPPVTPTTPVTSNQAQSVATALYAGANPVRTEITTNNGRRVWDVELDNGLAVYVDVTTGDVIEVERIGDNDNSDDIDAPSDTSTTISVIEAQRIATNLYPGTTVIDTDLEFNYGRRVWDVELDNGIAVYVDVTTGDIVEIEGDNDMDDDIDDDDDSGNGSGGSTTISAAEAANIALTRFPNATVIDTTLGTENGRQVWYIDLNNGFEVYVDATTGAIISVENDGSSNDDAGNDDSGDSGNDDSGSGTTTISAAEATNIALTRFPNATVIDTWLGTENGRQVWYVDLNNGFEVYVDANTGNIISVENDSNDNDNDFDDNSDDFDDIDDDDSGNGSGNGSAISASQAASIALTRFPNATVIDTWLGTENGRQVWYVDLNNGFEVYVDANTGNIISVENDSNDSNDNDNDFDDNFDDNSDDFDDIDDDDSGNGSGNGSAISASQAASIALTRFPNATVIDTWLGTENGRQVWYVDLSGSIEVYVDAITGAILTVERD